MACAVLALSLSVRVEEAEFGEDLGVVCSTSEWGDEGQGHWPGAVHELTGYHQILWGRLLEILECE